MYNSKMLTYEARVEIDRPADQVFMFLARYHEHFGWVGSVLAVEKVTPGAVGPGTRFKETVKFGRFENQVFWEVTVYEPPERLVFRSDSFLGQSKALFECIPLNGRTSLRAVSSGELKGGYRLLKPVFGFLGLRQRKKHLTRIKAELEGGS